LCQKRIEELKAAAEALRLEQERKAEEERKKREEAEEREKKHKKIALIITSVVCAVIAVIILLTTVIIPKIQYNNSISLYEDKSHFEIAITGSIPFCSAVAINLSMTKKFGFGSTVETTIIKLSIFATGGLFKKFFLSKSLLIVFSAFSLTEISTLSPTKGVILSFLNIPRALHS
jgi:cation transport ATPase